MMNYLVPFLAYLIGSIPFGLLITMIAGQGDIREIGSGNIGATNVLRTGKKSLAALTLVCDMLKGTAAVLLAYLVSPQAAIAAGLCALIGHLYPVWLKFKGGKGVATMLGVMLGLSWPAAIITMLLWLISAVILRISSASALIATAALPIIVTTLGRSDLLIVSSLIAILIYYKHAANIKRLLRGCEPKIGEKKKGNGDNAAATAE
ncbi:MAG: glycerol-3-phosphate 1-O-acyltransferase [Proteobacteria bacterium]|jgi:glycerol-3-phosphate acyltransferase PlsY|nr:glycerol-3-phosphate 1-O-acyltransferase PlsY [Alphaproteobacteria bacterium]NCC02559.1 glycerol-3-phosphate 1-O-acyltransferase [Pseudomonadota bacterium]